MHDFRGLAKIRHRLRQRMWLPRRKLLLLELHLPCRNCLQLHVTSEPNRSQDAQRQKSHRDVALLHATAPYFQAIRNSLRPRHDKIATRQRISESTSITPPVTEA